MAEEGFGFEDQDLQDSRESSERSGEMSSKADEVVQTTAVGNGEGSASQYEMHASEGAEQVEIAHALDEIEGKKKVWYAYLLTWEFWFVLALG